MGCTDGILPVHVGHSQLGLDAGDRYHRPMEERLLARGRLRVTRFGLGLAALGRPGYLNVGHGDDVAGATDVRAMERRAHELLDAAYAAGIRYVDAARSYGHAERFLAAWLRARGIGPDSVTVGTKWGYEYTAGWRVRAERHEVKDHSLATLRRQWGDTDALLHGRVDLLQVHSATLDSGILDDREVHAELARLRADGRVRALGLTLSGPGQAATLARAMELRDGSAPLFDTVQATWNPLEPSAGEALARAHAAGMGVIVKEALANGRLIRGSEATPLAAHAARLRTTTDALGLAHAIAQPWADIVLLGPTTLEQLRANLAALDVRPDAAATQTLELMAQPAPVYWEARAAMPWS